MKTKTSTIKLLYIDNANTAHRLTLDEFITRFNAGAINADAVFPSPAVLSWQVFNHQ